MRRVRYVGHTAIYRGQGANGIQVIDQWNRRDHDGHITGQHQPSERTIHFDRLRSARVDQGESYNVVH